MDHLFVGLCETYLTADTMKHEQEWGIRQAARYERERERGGGGGGKRERERERERGRERMQAHAYLFAGMFSCQCDVMCPCSHPVTSG